MRLWAILWGEYRIIFDPTGLKVTNFSKRVVAIMCGSWAHVGKENKQRAYTMSGQSTSLHDVSVRKLKG